MRRLIHKSDKGIVRLSRRSQDSCLSSTGREVSTELNREAVCHSGSLCTVPGARRSGKPAAVPTTGHGAWSPRAPETAAPRKLLLPSSFEVLSEFAIMLAYVVVGSRAIRYLKSSRVAWLERACGGARLAMAASLALFS
jgi:hypothetical protein